MVAGIHPSAPGFVSVRIQPNLGSLAWVDASMPHPAGVIRTSFHRVGESVNAQIELPQGVAGKLLWKGSSYDLHPGKQELTLP